ncbi:hypothetical protein DXG03_009050 [Asterophora parasitica]|uniref:protein-tyrosine-phosphatase n=1 Tax=Asterophora parasitica TaxID=117018 RepID=A0A9P7GBC1_9AGAR|nr:hypothetical protein DXG03_009050 [Asterophora parasitica]
MAKGAKPSSSSSSGATLILPPYLYLGPKTAATPALLSSSSSPGRAGGTTQWHVLSIGATPPGAPVPGVTYHRLSLLDDPEAGVDEVVERACVIIGDVARSWSDVTGKIDANTNTSTSTAASVLAKVKAQSKGNSGVGGAGVGGGTKKKILIHCSAAVSRSPTIVAAYLMRHHNMTLREALGTIIRARPAVCPNPGFLKQLQELDVRIHGAGSLDGVEVLPGRKEERVKLFA